MIVYIVRHGEAIEKDVDVPDEWRYLTDKGRKNTVSIGNRFKEEKIPSPGMIQTSPLVRAVQTAEEMAATCARKTSILVNGLLQPKTPAKDVIEFLNGCLEMKSVMLVGHEPQLGSLTAGLLGIDAVSLKKSSCIAIRIDSHKPAKFLWYMVPGKKLRTSLKRAFTT